MVRYIVLCTCIRIVLLHVCGWLCACLCVVMCSCVCTAWLCLFVCASVPAPSKGEGNWCDAAIKKRGAISVPKRGSLFVLQWCRTPFSMHVYTCADTDKHMQPTWSNAQAITFLRRRIYGHDPKHLVCKHMRRGQFMAWSLARVKAIGIVTEGRYALPSAHPTILATCTIARGVPTRGA